MKQHHIWFENNETVNTIKNLFEQHDHTIRIEFIDKFGF